MKIVANREKLLHAFQTVAPVAPTRSPKAILQNIKLDVAADACTLMATDLEVGIRFAVEGIEVEQPGTVLLRTDKLVSILRESSDETIEIEADGKHTTVKGSRSKFNLPVANPSEYPPVPSFDESSCYEVPARLLKELIRRTLFATDNESSRYALGGIKLESDGETLIAIGTDGRRLSKMEGPINKVGDPMEFGEATIVPAGSMRLIERTVNDDDAEVQIAVRQNEVLVKTPRATIYTRLLEGRFPGWRDVFPTRSESAKIELSVGPFGAAVRQAAIVTSDESRGVDFSFGNGTLVLAGKTADIGQSHVELPISYDGDDITIALDPRYMLDFLKVLDAEKTFTLDLENGDAAAVCSTDDGYGYVVMPLARDR
ncbi:DNA polymerase III subunit beta [Aeoliella mucimassa]|uniref:Beta sliding clamp n=1 Tax=Aeoliella mucimassa TaxID=2527972 RepID=A0A518AGK0_9BACT|nr:DNA polymerase III subunit beta [Aeoliella mucimassa]QDU53824.1 DNA polymerase III subunit beta [Aeoliella mucimassa]